MAIYWIIWFFICFLNFITSYKKPISKVFFIFSSVFLFFFIGFRYQVGADWGNYLFFYDLAKYGEFWTTIFSGDPAYQLLNYLGNYWGFQDTILVNVVCSLVVIVCFTKFALKYKYYWLVLLVYFPYHLLVVSMNYTRQSVAIAISLLAFDFLFNKKPIKFLFLIFCSALFHKTAIILLLFLPLQFIEYFKVKKILYYIYIISSIFVLTGAMYYFSIQDSNIYLQGNDDMTSKGFLVRWVYHIIPLFILYIYSKAFKFDKNIILIKYFILLILYLGFIGIFLSTLADRFNLYLIFFDLYVLCFIFQRLTRVNKYVLLISLILFYTLFMSLWFFYGEWAMRAWVPYQNYITNYLFKSVF